MRSRCVKADAATLVAIRCICLPFCLIPSVFEVVGYLAASKGVKTHQGKESRRAHHAEHRESEPLKNLLLEWSVSKRQTRGKHAS